MSEDEIKKKKREIVKNEKKNVKLKLKLIKPSVFYDNTTFYWTLNFKNRDDPEFDYIRISRLSDQNNYFMD